MQAAVELIDEGNTIPFIARYRKEATGSMDDQKLRQLEERLSYLRKLDEMCIRDRMVSAKALTFGDKKSPRLMAGGGGSAPYGIQLFGAEPQSMGEAAAMTAGGKYHVPFDFLDINMGCPAPKITGSGAGSALLKDPQLAGQVAQAVVKNAGAYPVTAKLRIGWDMDTLTGVEVAKRCELSLIHIFMRRQQAL